MYVHFYELNIWSGLLLDEVLHQCGVAWRRSPCGSAEVLEVQVDLMTAFRLCPLLVLVFLIFKF